MNIWSPEHFHGFHRKGPFFEGWFFKLVDPTRQHVFAVIPGIFLDGSHQTDHAFVQFLDGQTNRSTYHRFPADQFRADKRRFHVSIGSNHFSLDQMVLDIRSENRCITGSLSFHHVKPWPVKLFSPGVMGWYAFVPSMECYHGVLSMDHALSGRLNMENLTVRFDGGRGYIEKDWGTSFPSSYVWMQCNHFDASVPDASGTDASGTGLMVSVANIPWRKRFFRGFLTGFLLQGRLHRMTTYTGAQLEKVEITDQTVSVCVEDRRYRLKIEADRRAGGLLHGPDGRQMHQHISETLKSRIAVQFFKRRNQGNELLFEGAGYPAGLDVNGRLEEIADVLQPV